MDYETLETTADGKVRLLKASEEGSEYLYIDDGTGPRKISDGSQEIYNKDIFPDADIARLRNGFKKAGYPISKEWMDKFIEGISERFSKKML